MGAKKEVRGIPVCFGSGSEGLLEGLGGCYSENPFPAVLFLRLRVQPPPLNKKAGDARSSYHAPGPLLYELSSGELQLFLRETLVFPKEAEPGQACHWRQGPTLSSRLITLWRLA